MYIQVILTVCSYCQGAMVNRKTNPSFVLHGIQDVRFEEVSRPRRTQSTES